MLVSALLPSFIQVDVRQVGRKARPENGGLSSRVAGLEGDVLGGQRHRMAGQLEVAHHPRRCHEHKPGRDQAQRRGARARPINRLQARNRMPPR